MSMDTPIVESPTKIASVRPDAGGDMPPSSGQSSAVIRCVDVHKSYRLGSRTVSALRGVNLEIGTEDRGGGFYAIMGQSGSGKSTLLHLLAALDTPDQGEVYVAGESLHKMTERELTRFRNRRIGIVFQQFNLIPTFTAIENVMLPGILAGEPEDQLQERGIKLLETLGVAQRAGHRPDALSGGEQQRVAIARALLFQPSVLLADEPTGNLDSASSARLWNLLRELALERHMTVLMVTHEPAAAANCRRMYVLRDGVIIRNEREGTDGYSTEGLDAAGVAALYLNVVRSA